MSHNTAIRDVQITDLDALKRAVEELRGEGVRISFDEHAKTFRTWPGQDNRCDAVIGLPNQKFDVGLRKQADGSYIPVFDHMLDSNREIACSIDPNESRSDRHTIGKLVQRYAVCKAEKEAALAGHMVTGREVDTTTGEIKITVEV